MTADWWLDPHLTVLIGPLDPDTHPAIEHIIVDVVRQVLAPGNDPLDTAYFDRHAPWARDLARGLHWLALGHPPQPSTAQLIKVLAVRCPVDADQRGTFSHDLDVAYSLTYQRHIDTVVAHRASATVAADTLRSSRPWLDTMLLGWRIHLTVELLRLTRLDAHLD
jgi:hypothetical protein